MIDNNDLDIDITYFNVAENGVTTNTSTIDGVTTTQKSITFDAAEHTTMPVLPLYDILDETTHYILIKFASDKAFTLTISTETPYVLDSTKPLLSGDGRGTNYSNWMSSVLFFQNVVINDNSYSTTLSNDPFTFVDKSTYEMKANNTYSVECSANSSIYFIVGYDSTLINKLFSENIGNEDIQGLDQDLDNAGIKFVSDCIFKVIFADEIEEII